MIKIGIIGSGNVAQHLIVAFQKSIYEGAEIQITTVFSRQKTALSNLLDSNIICSDWDNLKEADIYLIAVSDSAIAEVSDKIPFKNKLVVHTSGAVSIEAINPNNRKGVFYPLQTFSKNVELDFNTIPICIECENTADLELLIKVANSISESVYEINSEQRIALHVAAVFVNNFTNNLYKIGNDICIENKIPFEIVLPLIKETAEKITRLSPLDAQTGPAIRNDEETINSHLEFLTNENQKNIYKLLTQSIQNNGKKL
jgi:predicted short-subunit dehydrogenase-like oxidoreductase (DUF2520 family)